MGQDEGDHSIEDPPLFGANGPFYFEPDDEAANQEESPQLLSPNPFTQPSATDEPAEEGEPASNDLGILAGIKRYFGGVSAADESEYEQLNAAPIVKASYAPSESTLTMATSTVEMPANSYQALQQQQAAVAKHYLRELGEGVHRASPPLLPLASHGEGVMTPSRGNPDWPWTGLYLTLFAVCLLHSLIYGTVPSLPRHSLTLLKPVCLSMLVVIPGTIGWVWLLQRYPQRVLQVMAMAVPMGGGLAGLICLATWSAGWGVLLIALSALLYWLGRRRLNLSVQVALWRMAATVIWERPGALIGGSGVLMAAMALFGGWWVSSWLAMTQGGWLIRFIYLLAAAWTASLFMAMQRVLVGAIVTRWYFCRHAAITPNESPWPVILQCHGQICLAAALLSAIRLLRHSVNLCRRLPAPTITTRLTQAMALLLSLLERLGEHVSSHALYWLAMNQKQSFCEAGRAVWRIYRRNLLTSLTTTSLTAGLLSFASWTVALLSLMVFHATLGTGKALLVAWLCWCESQLLFSLVRDTIEASFLCYAIDLDTERVHCQPIHQAYATLLNNQSDLR